MKKIEMNWNEAIGEICLSLIIIALIGAVAWGFVSCWG